MPNPSTLGLRGLRWALAPVFLLLAGCDAVVMHPTGDVALQQRDLILISTGLMLLIIVPVMVATALFAWRYRASNKDAHYDPDFDHSTMLELVIWSAPLLIIICLGAVTWSSSHLLDPYRPVDRIAAGQPVPKGTKPLEVQVVALDWKWMFIYPDLGIATVNELATPVNVPVHFRLTGTSVMNTLYVPTLAGMVYAMPGMETSLHAVVNKPVESRGFSANYSGAGFSDMNFPYHGMAPAAFAQWVQQVKASGDRLDRNRFMQIEKPSENVPPHRFGAVEAGLFERVVNRCVQPGRPCMSDMMNHDRKAGGGNPHVVRPGEGNPPVNNVGPMHGEKANGALFKTPEEKGSSPHLTKPRQPGTPGNTEPGTMKNRDLSFLRAPGTAGAARA